MLRRAAAARPPSTQGSRRPAPASSIMQAVSRASGRLQAFSGVALLLFVCWLSPIAVRGIWQAIWVRRWLALLGAIVAGAWTIDTVKRWWPSAVAVLNRTDGPTPSSTSSRQVPAVPNGSRTCAGCDPHLLPRGGPRTSIPCFSIA